MATKINKSTVSTSTLSNGATMTILSEVPKSTRRDANGIAKAVTACEAAICVLINAGEVVQPKSVLAVDAVVSAGANRTDVAKAASNLMNRQVIRQHAGFKHARWIAFDSTIDETVDGDEVKATRARRDKATVENARQTARSAILAMLASGMEAVQRKNIMADAACIEAGVKDNDLAFVVDAMITEGVIAQHPDFQRGRWVLPAKA